MRTRLSKDFKVPAASLHFVLVDHESAATIAVFSTPPSFGSGYGMAVFPRGKPSGSEQIAPGLWATRPASCSAAYSLVPETVGSVAVTAGFVDPLTTTVKVLRGGRVILERAVHQGVVSLQAPLGAQVEFFRGSELWAAVPTLDERLPKGGPAASASCRTTADAFLTAVVHGRQPPAGIDASGMAPASIAIDLHQLLSAGGWSTSGPPTVRQTNFAYPLTDAAGHKGTLYVAAGRIDGSCRVYNYDFIAR